MTLKNINNLIFDLGGVIIDLDFQAVYEAFASLARLSVDEVQARIHGFTQFINYEKGLISSGEFRDQVRDLFQLTSSDQEIDNAWCEILAGIPQVRLELLNKLRHRYRIFALSNTNDIHARKFNSIIEDALDNATLFTDHFEKLYLSHELKMRKPEAEIYRLVLEDQGIAAQETLFIDDTLENIQGAQALGIQTLHLENPDHLITFFNGTQ